MLSLQGMSWCSACSDPSLRLKKAPALFSLPHQTRYCLTIRPVSKQLVCILCIHIVVRMYCRFGGTRLLGQGTAMSNIPRGVPFSRILFRVCEGVRNDTPCLVRCHSPRNLPKALILYSSKSHVLTYVLQQLDMKSNEPLKRIAFWRFLV